MRKMTFLSILAACLLATGCSKGVSKEYEMTVKEIVEVKKDSGEYVRAAYCRRSVSLYNYYIEIPEEALARYDAADPALDFGSLYAKTDGKEINYSYGKDKVTNHGYEFVRWAEKGASK